MAASETGGDTKPAEEKDQFWDEIKTHADALKDEGNKLLGAGKVSLAVAKYTQAIELYPTAIYHSNRAMAHLKLENYGVAIQDADAAINLDSSYIKAYYRKASANLALGRYKLALKDFKQVCRIAPQDRGARLKLKECEKAYKRQQFEAAIMSEHRELVSQTINLQGIVVEPGYTGPKLASTEEMGLEHNACNDDVVNWTKVSPAFCEQIMDTFKSQGLPHRRFVVQVLLCIRKQLAALPTLLRLRVPENKHFTVCGDTHGQFFDLCNIFEINGKPSTENPYLFNGDYVDRGSFSFEVVFMLFCYKLAYPDGLHLTRGNHESTNMNKIYGFEGEVKHKYDDKVMNLFTEVFRLLPLAATINDKVFVTHGGLSSQDDTTLADINAIDRNREPPESTSGPSLMSDLLWSDPQPFPGRAPSKRGIGMSFGPDVTARFLEYNDLKLVVRSHEVKEEGYLVEHDGKCITVFSAPNYCDQMGNKGALIRFDESLEPNFVQFSAVPHPNIRPMAYAQNMGMMMGM